MLNTLLNKIFPTAQPAPIWTPAPQIVVKDSALKNDLETQGYTIAARLSDETLQQLKTLYQSTHQFNLAKGGMFYSVYSENTDYRLHVHQTINQILGSLYDELFLDYKIVISSFIIKVNGPDSEFGLHQDSTGLDELKYSPISVWIPLQDTTVENGCLAVVPQSFKLFSPYRGISFPEPYHEVQDEVKHYLQPIDLKAGEVLLFDNRLVHYSPPNTSDQARVVVMSGIFPKEAKIISCYKDLENRPDQIEIFEQKDDHLLTFKNFFHNCTCRPETGEMIQKVNWPQANLTKKQFVNMMGAHDIPRVSHPKLIQSYFSNIVPEPVYG